MDQRDHLGRYSLVRRVGAGGFATVWLARDEQLDAEVAIKVLSENWIDEDDVRRRFIAEGRFLRRVQSRHVVGVHDIGETEDGRPYLVLTYADGGSLAERIKAGPMEIATVVDVLTQVGTGLQHLHDRGVLHRDVKPANVLFQSEPDGGERAMLGDLGLGKSLDAVSQLTMPGGTPAYVAPEQVMGERLDERADLYSLGAVAYAALTGQPPHGPISLGAVLRIDSPPPPMATLRPEVSAAIDAVVRRALQPDRDQRWPSLAAFRAALTEAHETGKFPVGALDSVSVSEVVPGPNPGLIDQPTAAADTALPTSAAGAPTALAQLEKVDPDTPVVEERSGPSRLAWVIAIVLAVVLGGGGGYAGYTFMSKRPFTVEHEGLTVEVPRSWSQMSKTTWSPLKGKPDQPALLVGEDLANWGKTGATPPGVFIGRIPIPTLTLPSVPPAGCESSDVPELEEINGHSARTWLYQCRDGRFIYDRHIGLDEGHSLRIQVQSSNIDDAGKVLNSATNNSR
ncbi:protein kinase [Kribbella sp. NBC_01245]|uniref:serine/threonine-protein kinase n=1 Tax=Kribbella sp. NBC_01245 TaxID=2903578 RepID=UPI002E2A1B4F|nr:protein kinase [Kribbella sp. NBC_01245]